jgi:hypothetical protein
MLQYNIIVYESMQLADITADAYKDKLLVVVVVVWFPDPSLAS